MTVAEVAVSPAATLVGGLLAGTGGLHAELTVEEVVAELDALRDSPSYWVPWLFADDAARERRTREISRRLAPWSTPDPTLLQQTAGVLDEGWRRAQLEPGPWWAPPALRFQADSLAALRQLQAIDKVGEWWKVVGHLRMRAGRIAWTWPLRVTAPDAAGLDALRSTLQYDRYYRVVEAAEGDVVDIAVVDPGTVDFLERVTATVTVVLGADDAFDPTELLDNATRIGLAAVLLVPNPPAGLIDQLIREVSHDEPLDVAAALVVPQATFVASPEILALSSIRTWAAFVAERIGTDAGVGQRLEQILRGAPFDHESGGGDAALEATSEIPEADLRSMTEFSLHMAGAEPPPLPPEEEPTARELPEIDLGEEVVAPPDQRRLQAKVSDESKRDRTDAFVAGTRHQVRVRIAKEAGAGVVVADATFRPPVAGQDVELSVVVRLRGTTGKPKRRTLQLPASADSKWTSPVPIDVPADAKEIAIEIVVLHEGRTVQSAVLSGPVVDAAAAPVDATALTLAVDADTPPSDLAARSRTASTILVSGGLKGEPFVLDLSASGRLLPAERLDKAAKAIRQILYDTFQSPPTDLAGAAGPLTRLAVWGATLRNQLKTGTGGFHDEDPWIHVVSFGDALIPFELIYTHKMPDSDVEVPVCDTALGGATECAANCPDRGRSDRVCPFGFWATSKVVERRVHVDNRTRSTAPVQRKVAVISGAVAGMSSKADADDPNASQRISDALTAAVPKDRFRRVTTWKDLADAVDVGRPGVIVLVTHTVKPPNEDDLLAVKFELGGDVHPAHRVDDSFVNPGLREPGPVVLALGCDTGDLDIGFADWITTLHAAGAEVVVSTLSPVPGKEVAMFVERMFALLPKQFALEPPHRFGAVLTEVRRATVATGDVLALSVTASGDGDVELVGAL